ncbi:MFS transporter [Ideonella sp.]|uniref:MFS transporter n=1 Tax=Ideonella sp. TaxID=1929293 RepID=UPI003BB75933
MDLFPQTSLNAGVRKREVFGWAMYDFANSGYTTVVLTAVFNAYFVSVVAQGAVWATLAWTLCLALSSAVVMLTMPALGAWADRHAAKKKVLSLATAGCVAGTAALAWAGPGDLWLAAAAVLFSNVFFCYGEALTAAFLPELARRDSLGRVSGWGWSFGYFGGMLTLGLCLAHVLAAQARGEPASQFVPVTMLITAGVFAVAALATFGLLKERAQVTAASSHHTGSALARMFTSLREVRDYPDFRALLLCAVAYQAGIAVVIALAAVYAEQVLGFKQLDTMALVFLVNIASAAGAFLWGYAQDRLGHQLALGVTLWGWIAMVLMAAAASSRPLFWAAALLAGLCMGASQSAGRALAGLLAPASRLAEFFGLWAMAVRFAAILGPVTYGVVVWVSAGNHRAAILSTAVFFAAGLLLLRRVQVARGAALALADPS